MEAATWRWMHRAIAAGANGPRGRHHAGEIVARLAQHGHPHTMGQPRPVNFFKDLPLPCDLQPVKVENQEEWDFCPGHDETETAEDSDTLASVLMSLNLKM